MGVVKGNNTNPLFSKEELKVRSERYIAEQEENYRKVMEDVQQKQRNGKGVVKNVFGRRPPGFIGTGKSVEKYALDTGKTIKPYPSVSAACKDYNGTLSLSNVTFLKLPL